MTNTESPHDVIARVFASLTETSERRAYVRALRERGWTLDAISQASSLTRERVRQAESTTTLADALDFIVRSGNPLPEMPPATVTHKPRYANGRSHTWAPDPSPETLARLRTLKPLAEKVRSSSPAFREESEEYTALLDFAIREEGTTVYRLAKLLGVTHGALYFRLTRYGYRSPKGSTSKVYQRINPANRVKRETVTGNMDTDNGTTVE